jgi:hypothetical protein
VILAVAVTVLVLRGNTGSTVAGPPPSTTPATAPATTATTAPPKTGTAAPPPSGQVTIASPADGAVVKKCEHVSGAATLPPADTIMYAVNRVSPPDKAWYYGYLGSYDSGNVPSTWSGDVYFGSAASQKYDLFVYVMSVNAAGKFWNAHKSSDGSYAFGTAAPSGVRPAAHVRVTQGSLSEC